MVQKRQTALCTIQDKFWGSNSANVGVIVFKLKHSVKNTVSTVLEKCPKSVPLGVQQLVPGAVPLKGQLCTLSTPKGAY